MNKIDKWNNQSLDELTELPGRDALESLATSFKNRQSSSIWTVLMIDVDHFKLINDIHGHLAGDQVLMEISSILKQYLPSDGVMIRFGGDEFLGVFRDINKTQGLEFAEKVLHHARNTVIARNLKLTLSIGLSESNPDDISLNEIIDRADKALYNAKASGRGRVCCSDQSIKSDDSKILLSYFVGRQSELNRIKQMLDESLTEGARFVLIEGEPGVGKTRLAKELTRYADFKQCSILQSEWFEFGDTEPYSFLTHPIHDTLVKQTKQQLTSIVQAVGAVHPATAELFPDIEFTVSEDILFFREERLKFRIYEDFSRIIHYMTQAVPYLLFLDDVQWISSPDLDLLKFLFRSTQRDRILYVTTMRSREPQSDDIRRQLNSLRRTLPFLLLKLTNLNQQETANLVMFALKDPNIPEHYLKAFHRQSGGNPFFLQEMINSLIQSGSITPNPSGGWSYYLSKEIQLPESLAQLIDSRLKPLDEISRNYLRVAALAIGSFEIELICAATEDSFVTVVQGLEQPIKMGLIVSEQNRYSDQTYRFTHDTVCHFLHRELSNTMKSHYHGNMARYYEIRYGQGDRDDAIPAMAHHYSSTSNRSKAIWASFLAAELYNKREATRETIRWLNTYFSFDPIELDTKTNLYQAHLTLGDKFSSIGEGEKADSHYNKADKLSDSLKDHVTVQRRKAINFQMMSRYDDSRICCEYVQSKANDPLIMADILDSIAFLDYITGNLPEARKKTQEAESLLESATCDIQLLERYRANHYTTRGIVECCIEVTNTSISYYEKAMELFEKYGDLLGQATIYSNLADVYPRTGDYEKTLDILKKAEIIYGRLDEALGLAIVYYNTAITYTEINQPDLAQQYFQKYSDLNPTIQNQLGLGYNNLGIGLLNEEEGNALAAEESYRSALKIFNELGSRNLAFVSRLCILELLIKKADWKSARHEYSRITQEKTQFSDKEIEDQFLFVKGLMALSCPDKKRDLEKAEQFFIESIERNEFIELSEIIKRSYYLAITQKQLNKLTEFHNTIKSALDLLDQRLGKITKGYIRKNILNKHYIQKLLSLNHELNGSNHPS